MTLLVAGLTNGQVIVKNEELFWRAEIIALSSTCDTTIFVSTFGSLLPTVLPSSVCAALGGGELVLTFKLELQDMDIKQITINSKNLIQFSFLAVDHSTTSYRIFLKKL